MASEPGHPHGLVKLYILEMHIASATEVHGVDLKR